LVEQASLDVNDAPFGRAGGRLASRLPDTAIHDIDPHARRLSQPPADPN